MTAAGKKASVHTIAPDKSFLDSVAAGILQQTAGDPLKLADVTILVPDRETGFLLKSAFMEQLQGKPVILPKIDAPGDMDDDTIGLKVADNPVLSQALMDIPPAVSRLHRQLILAREIRKMPGMASSLQKAVKLGGELGRFLDEAQRNDVDLADIDRLVPPAFQKQWAGTAQFLKIITDTWPKELEKMGMVDPEEHKNAVIRIRATHWEQSPPSHPVFAVGFTDTSPAVLHLLRSVAAMPQGNIVLPGVDLDLDDASWKVLGPVHPQFTFKKMLAELGCDRAGVAAWQAGETHTDLARATRIDKTNDARRTLLREAMRPAGTAEGWSTLKSAAKPASRLQKKLPVNDNDTGIHPEALNGIDLIVCGSPQEESSVIALKMREILETPGRTGHLVTADRDLARRVSARLRHWQIEVPDNAGLSLDQTAAGIFLLATGKMATDEWAPVSLLEALKHPLAALGESKKDFRGKLALLEDMALHGPRPAPGADGVKDRLQDAFNKASKRKGGKAPEILAAEKAALEQWLEKLRLAGADFFAKISSKQPVPFKEVIDAHIRFAEALAATDKQTGPDRLWRGDDGVKATRFLSNLREAAACVPEVSGRDYLDLLQGLMHDVSVKPRASSHPSLRILTPEQAVLSKADTIILGGLNDEVWPCRVDENPWLSPDMIGKLGLPAPEESIGRSARHFVQMASRPNVLLTRSVRSGNAPAVSSPFLTRLLMVLKGAGLETGLDSKSRLLDIHTAMHTPASVTPVEPPEPRPPVKDRPKELPVTAIEALMRDPYTVYAKYVLKLRPKDPIDTSPSVSERGIFTHAALETFIDKFPDKMPDNAYEELLKIGEDTFKTRMNSPAVQSFWWPRFERIAKWFVRFEAERREMTKTLGTEVRGKLEIDLGGEMFTLTCIADRIDRGADDKLSLIDYKTGSVPSQKSVGLGFSPQLTLEALIAYTGGFDKIDAGDVGNLEYWKLSGGRPAGDVTEVRGDVPDLVDAAREGITNLAKAFNDPKTPYLATPRPEWAPRYNNYEHLSRVGEWSTVKKIAKKKTKKKTTSRQAGGGKRGPKA